MCCYIPSLNSRDSRIVLKVRARFSASTEIIIAQIRMPGFIPLLVLCAQTLFLENSNYQGHIRAFIET